MSAQIEVLQVLCRALRAKDWESVRDQFVEHAVLVEGAMRALDPCADVRFEGIDEILGFFQQETTQGDGFDLRPIDFMEDGNRVAMFWESERQTDQGTDYSRGVDVFVFSESRIASGRVYLDLAPED